MQHNYHHQVKKEVFNVFIAQNTPPFCPFNIVVVLTIRRMKSL